MTFPEDAPAAPAPHPALRRMVRETRLSRDDLVLPLFVVEGRGVREPVASMPGVLRFSADTVVTEAKQVRDAGIPAVLLFGIPDQKDARGSGADAANGVVQRAVDAIKSAEPDLCVITDVCLCEYTDHGHCGIVENGDVANDPTLDAPGRGGPLARPRRRRRGGALRHDGRARGRDPRRARRSTASRRSRSSPTPRSSRAPTTGPSARRPRARRASATAAATRWTRPIAARRCARCAPTSRKAPTC